MSKKEDGWPWGGSFGSAEEVVSNGEVERCKHCGGRVFSVKAKCVHFVRGARKNQCHFCKRTLEPDEIVLALPNENLGWLLLSA